MSKREKIILGLMLFVVLIGGYLFLFDSKDTSKKSPVYTMDEVKAIKADVDKEIVKSVLLKKEQYTIEVINKPWDKDPFRILTPDQPEVAKVEESSGDSIEFSYTAFVDVGNLFIGVINSREYEAGDMLAQDGYRLVRIDAKSALIKGPGDNNMIVVPYQEYIQN